MRGLWGAAWPSRQPARGGAVDWLPETTGSLPKQLHGEWPSEGVMAQCLRPGFPAGRPSLLLSLRQTGQGHQPGQGGRRVPSMAGMGVSSFPQDHHCSHSSLPPPQGSSCRLGPHQHHLLGGGSGLSGSRLPLALPPLAPGKQKVRGPQGSYLAPPPPREGAKRGTPPPHSPSSADSSRHFHRRKFPEVRGGKRLIPFIQWVPPTRLPPASSLHFPPPPV